MIDADIGRVIDAFNQRAQDALGYNVPGYQPAFHDVLQRQVRSVKTFDPLSVVAPENTYFVIDNGDGSHSYSRGGDFRITQGRLVDRNGCAVLGYPNGMEKGTLAPITVPADVPDGNVRIANDGTISYVNAAPSRSAAIALPDTAGHRTPPLAVDQTFDDNGRYTGGPTTATDAAMSRSFMAGAKASSTEPVTMPTAPLGKLALARFASGTVVTNGGLASSIVPLEMGPPGTGGIAVLKSGYRDVGSVDHMTSKLQVSEANTTMYAMIQLETARQSNVKKAMDLIK